MQITTNTTGMEAGLCVATDKEGRDYCVVVVKATFSVDKDGATPLAEKQEPLIYADVHYGDPSKTSIKYECDFARFKPMADIIVNGHAYSPGGKPVTETMVGLEVGSLKKVIRVVGDRHWEKRTIGLAPSEPTSFIKMPLVFERAFGGSDHSHKDPKHHGSETRNLVGVGFHKNSDTKSIEGTHLPNLEHPRDPMKSWYDTPPPMGFGVLARNWLPRVKHAGTYDEKWLNERFPFLPDDFSDCYFQAPPPDQQVPFPKGGEAVRCMNMTPDMDLMFTVPRVAVPITFRFKDRNVVAEPNLDTVIVEPDQRRVLVAWRATVPVGRKLTALREIVVGAQPRNGPQAAGKPHFRSLAELSEWRKGLRQL